MSFRHLNTVVIDCDGLRDFECHDCFADRAFEPPNGGRSMRSNGNQPAFARPFSLDTYGDHPAEEMAHEGLTKREYFAAMVMQGLAAYPENVEADDGARTAVLWADALLLALAGASV